MLVGVGPAIFGEEFPGCAAVFGPVNAEAGEKYRLGGEVAGQTSRVWS
jgi:hypothetical protein